MLQHYKPQQKKVSEVAQKFLLSDGEHAVLATIPMKLHLLLQKYRDNYEIEPVQDNDIISVLKSELIEK